MKRAIVFLVAVLGVLFGLPAVALADDASGGFQSDGAQGPVTAVVGTVVSTNSQNGSFVANASVVPMPSFGKEDGDNDSASGDGSSSGSDNSGSGAESSAQRNFSWGQNGGDSGPGWGWGDQGSSSPTQVTITTDPNTKIRVNGEDGTVANLSPGDKFVALFKGSPSDGIDALVANPALAVFDRGASQHRQLYAFVGTVTGVDPTAGTLTVNVSASLPNGLVPSGSGPVTFTVGPETLVLGGSGGNGLSGGSLSNVGVGDVVAGGLVAPAGETLTQIESVALKLLLDLPASSVPSSNPTAMSQAKSRVLREALRFLGVPGSKGGGGHHGKNHKPKKKHGGNKHGRKTHGRHSRR